MAVHEERVTWPVVSLAAALLVLFATTPRALAQSCDPIPAARVVPDDYATIQQAVDASTGGIYDYWIQIRPGTYAEGVDIVGKTLDISCLGGRPLIAPPDGLDGIRVRNGTYTQNLTIRGIDIVGGNSGIRGKSLGFVQISDVTVTNSRRHGISVQGGGLTVRRTSVSGSLHGSGFKVGVHHPQVYTCVASGNAKDGFRIGSRSTVHQARVADSAAVGNGKTGITLVTKGPSRIEGNRSDANEGSGLFVKAVAVTPDLTNNQANGNGIYGIAVTGVIGSLTPTLLMANGNVASGNAILDYHLD